MKKIIIFLIILILIPNCSYAKKMVNKSDTTSIIKKQEEKFGIKDFIKDCEKYSPNFMRDLNINSFFNNTVSGKFDNKGVLKSLINPLKNEFIDVLKIVISIIAIVLIHSILKAVTDGLENSNVSQIVYYVQYILIITIIMASFSDIINSITSAIDNMVGFAKGLIPLLITLMVYTGNIITSSIIEPILLLIIELIANIIKAIILPVISLIIALIIVSKISDRVQIQNLSKFMKTSIVWLLGIILTVFVGVLSLEGNLTSAIDGVTAKTAKAAVSSLIPVVRQSTGRWCR